MFNPQEPNHDAEPTAEELRAISRFSGWRESLGEAKFTMGILAVIVLAIVAWAASIGALVALGAVLLTLIGANLGMSAGYFFGAFVAFFAVAFVARFILAVIRE